MEEKRNYCVYMHQNKINGKKYIGMTGKAPKDRWEGGSGYAKQSYFYNAIQKYTWNGFYHVVLEENLSFQECCNLEKYYIQKFKSYDREYGYNIALGGSGTKSFSDETKQKISDSLWKHKKKVICLTSGKIFNSVIDAEHYYNVPNPNIIKNCKGKRRYAGKDFNGVPLIWRYFEEGLCQLTKEEVEEIAYAPYITIFSKKIICLNTNEIFESIESAQRKYGLFGVRQCCDGRYHSSGMLNGVALEWMYYEDYKNANFPTASGIKHNKKCTKVRCLNDNKIYESLIDAAKYYNIKNYQQISANCRGKAKTVGSQDNKKYQFEYYIEGES